MSKEEPPIPLPALSARERGALEALATREGLDPADYAVYRDKGGLAWTASVDEGKVSLEVEFH